MLFEDPHFNFQSGYRRVCLFLLFFTLVCCGRKTGELKNVFPELKGRVNDFAGVIDSDSKKCIEALIQAVQDSGLARIIVCTVDTIPRVKKEYENALYYATDLFNCRGIGDKKKNDGLLILVSARDRKMAICNGYGIENILSDSASGRIIEKNMIPYFKRGEFGMGIVEGIQAIEREMDENIRWMYPENRR